MSAMTTRLTKAQREREVTALGRFAVLASVATALAKSGWPKLYYVPMGKYGSDGDRYVHTVLAINEFGEIEDVGRYVHYLTGLKLKKDSSWVISRYASDITEHVNRAFEKRGWSKETFRGHSL